MMLYLIRHGQTASNRDGVGLGRSDLSLTDEGQRQAAALAEALAPQPIERMLVSPLQRAMQTAQLVAGERGIAIEPRDELLELDVGLTEGLPFPEIRERYGDFLAHWQSESCASTRMPGGESLDDVSIRVEPLVEEIRDWTGESMAVVAHNFVLRVMLCQLLRVPLHYFRAMPLGLASLTTLSLDRGRVNIQALNDRCHLENA